jgi:CheY-like chemotaxis protein
VLTKDDFARQFVGGQKEYADIEVVSNLQYALDGLLADIGGPGGGAEEAEKKAELIGAKVLTAGKKGGDEQQEMALKFDAETKSASFEVIKDSLQGLKVAVIDDDFVIRELLKYTFQAAGALVFPFADGDEFLNVIDTDQFDLAFVDLNMPRVDGFEVLKAVQARDIHYPVIVLSAVTHRETVIRAFQMGIKSYLVKPLKPEDIFKKSLEILKANF